MNTQDNRPTERPDTTARTATVRYRAAVILSVLLICGGIAGGVLYLSSRENTKPSPEEKAPEPSSAEMGAQLPAAAANGNKDIVRLLLEKGADVTAKDKEENTAYSSAEDPGIKQLILSYQR